MQNKPPQQPPPIKVDVSKFPDIKCACGSRFYKIAMTVKVIPPLVSGTGRQELFTTPHFLCEECGTPIDPNGAAQKEPA